MANSLSTAKNSSIGVNTHVDEHVNNNLEVNTSLTGAEPTSQIPHATVVLAHFKPLLTRIEQGVLNGNTTCTDANALANSIANKEIAYESLPKSIALNREFALHLLKHNVKVLNHLPASLQSDRTFLLQAIRNNSTIVYLLNGREQLNPELIALANNYTCNPNQILQFSSEQLEKNELKSIMTRLPDLPRATAINLLVAAFYGLWSTNKNFKEVTQYIHEQLSDIWPRLPKNVSVAIAPLMNTDTSKPCIDSFPKDTIVTDLYQDSRCLVRCSNYELYFGFMKHWFKSVNIHPFQLSDTLIKKSEGSPSPLTLFEDSNSLLLVSQKDIEHFRSSLNGLLESGRWEILGQQGKIVGRIVVVVEKDFAMKKDWLSRLTNHIDSLSLLPIKKTVRASQASAQESKATKANVLNSALDNVKLTIEHDRQLLLDNRYVTLQTTFANSLQQPMHPLLISSKRELEMLSTPPASVVQPTSLSISDHSCPHLIKQLPQSTQLPYSLFLLESAAQVDSLIDHHLHRLNLTGQEIEQHLLNTDVFVNSANSIDPYAAVFRQEQPYLIYKGTPYQIKSLSRSALGFNTDDIKTRSYAFEQTPLWQDYLHKGYFNSTPFTESKAANLLFDNLSTLLTSDKSILFIEGDSGVGKDTLISLFCQTLVRIDYQGVVYQRTTAGYENSPFDELLALREQHPQSLILFHVDESNNQSRKAWEDIMLLALKDQNIKIIGSQNSPDMGHRYRHPSEWARLILPNLDAKEMELCIQHIARNHDCKLFQDPGNAKTLSVLHTYIIERVRETPNLRQLDTFIRLLSKKTGSEITKREVYEVFVRAYSHFIPPSIPLPMYRFLQVLKPIRYAAAATNTSNSSSAAMYRQLSGSSQQLGDRFVTPGKLAWQGFSNNFITDDVGQYQLKSSSTTNKKRRQDYTLESVTLAPNSQIKLMSHVNSVPLIVPLSEKGIMLRTKALEIKRVNNECYMMRNIRKNPIKVRLELSHVPRFFTHNMRSIPITTTEQTLTSQEHTLVQRIISRIATNSAMDLAHVDVTEQKAHLAQHFGVTEQLGQPYSPERMIEGLFHYFKTFCKTKFTETPIEPALEPLYQDLYHSFINRSGVCRHQALLMSIILRYFNIPAEVHANGRHAFVAIDNKMILDIGYFINPLSRQKFDELSDQVKALEKLTTESLTIDQEAFASAQKIVYSARPDQYSLDEIMSSLMKLNPVEEDKKPAAQVLPLAPDNPKHSANSAEQPKGSGTRGSTQHKQAAIKRITPESLITALTRQEIAITDLPTIIAQNPKIPIQSWLAACSLERNIFSSNPDESLKPAAKKRRLSEEGHTAVADHNAEEEKTELDPIAIVKSEALKAIFYQLLSQVPSGSITVRRFIPDGASGKRPYGRITRVPGGFLARFQRPSVDLGVPITFKPVETFEKPYWIITAKGPRFIKTDQEHDQISPSDESFITLSEADLTVFNEVKNTIGIQ